MASFGAKQSRTFKYLFLTYSCDISPWHARRFWHHTKFIRDHDDFAKPEFGDFQDPLLLNYKTFKIPFGFQGLCRTCKMEKNLKDFSRTCGQCAWCIWFSCFEESIGNNWKKWRWGFSRKCWRQNVSQSLRSYCSNVNVLTSYSFFSVSLPSYDFPTK